MLSYITIGINNFQRAVDSGRGFKFLAYSRLRVRAEDSAVWGDENKPDEALASVFVKPLTTKPQRRVTVHRSLSTLIL